MLQTIAMKRGALWDGCGVVCRGEEPAFLGVVSSSLVSPHRDFGRNTVIAFHRKAYPLITSESYTSFSIPAIARGDCILCVTGYTSQAAEMFLAEERSPKHDDVAGHSGLLCDEASAAADNGDAVGRFVGWQSENRVLERAKEGRGLDYRLVFTPKMPEGRWLVS